MVTGIQKVGQFYRREQNVFYVDTIKWDNFIARQSRLIFLHDGSQIFVGRFYWQTKSANFVDRLTSFLRLLPRPSYLAFICWLVC